MKAATESAPGIKPAVLGFIVRVSSCEANPIVYRRTYPHLGSGKSGNGYLTLTVIEADSSTMRRIGERLIRRGSITTDPTIFS
ncbi:MAG TPA: hypothetical protein PLM91_09455 [Bacillota bacterium]|nr:hypothetical protein [Bacillota bacterium]HOL52409.1 hypothetical protein [Bacillota bacterium]